jgi:hypothetical protein
MSKNRPGDGGNPMLTGISGNHFTVFASCPIKIDQLSAEAAVMAVSRVCFGSRMDSLDWSHGLLVAFLLDTDVTERWGITWTTAPARFECHSIKDVSFTSAFRLTAYRSDIAITSVIYYISKGQPDAVGQTHGAGFLVRCYVSTGSLQFSDNCGQDWSMEHCAIRPAVRPGPCGTLFWPSRSGSRSRPRGALRSLFIFVCAIVIATFSVHLSTSLYPLDRSCPSNLVFSSMFRTSTHSRGIILSKRPCETPFMPWPWPTCKLLFPGASIAAAETSSTGSGSTSPLKSCCLDRTITAYIPWPCACAQQYILQHWDIIRAVTPLAWAIIVMQLPLVHIRTLIKVWLASVKARSYRSPQWMFLLPEINVLTPQ